MYQGRNMKFNKSSQEYLEQDDSEILYLKPEVKAEPMDISGREANDGKAWADQKSHRNQYMFLIMKQPMRVDLYKTYCQGNIERKKMHIPRTKNK